MSDREWVCGRVGKVLERHRNYLEKDMELVSGREETRLFCEVHMEKALFCGKKEVAARDF